MLAALAGRGPGGHLSGRGLAHLTKLDLSKNGMARAGAAAAAEMLGARGCALEALDLSWNQMRLGKSMLPKVTLPSGHCLLWLI